MRIWSERIPPLPPPPPPLLWLPPLGGLFWTRAMLEDEEGGECAS